MEKKEPGEENFLPVEKYLDGAKYPCDKEDLARQAHANGAGEEIIMLIGKLPDERYESPEDVSKALERMRKSDLSAPDIYTRPPGQV